MKTGIIGFASSGKTTIFNALTGLAATSPGAKPGRVNLREVRVPDERIDRLSAFYHPAKTTYAAIQLVDLPGKAPGSGGGFDPHTVGQMRELDLLVIVARAFESPYVVEDPDPAGEVAAMMAELLLADLAVVERRVDRLRRERAKGNERELFERILQHIEEEKWLRDLDLSDQERTGLQGYRFLTQKPVLVVVNTPEGAADEPTAQTFLDKLDGLSVSAFPLSAKLEAEIAELDPEEQRSFLDDLGLEETARDRFIRAAYAELELISFFTVGEDEVRAWTVGRGATAQQAAGKIHTDLAKHFIRAERMRWDELLAAGSEAKLKELGKMELKGKDYLVEDGDILHVLANA